MKLKKVRYYLVALFAFVLLSAYIFISSYHVLFHENKVYSSVKASKVFIIDDNIALIIWSNLPIMIYRKERWVGRAPDYRNKFMGIKFWPNNTSVLFWPRGSYKSIPLGDGVKGNSSEKFLFDKDNIYILAQSNDDQLSKIEISFYAYDSK